MDTVPDMKNGTVATAPNALKSSKDRARGGLFDWGFTIPWLRTLQGHCRPVKCKNCKHGEIGYFVGINGGGVYRVSWCGLDAVIRQVVDRESSRRCLRFAPRALSVPWWKGIADSLRRLGFIS